MSLWNARTKNKIMGLKDIDDQDVIIATDVKYNLLSSIKFILKNYSKKFCFLHIVLETLLADVFTQLEL